MEIETLKRSHLKRNILIGVVVVAIISTIVLNFTRAKYRVTESIPLVNGTINYTPYDFKIMAMYQESDTGEYVEIDEMPGKWYMINETESYCTLDNVNKDNDARLYTMPTGEHVISGLKKNSKCYLYFDEMPVILTGDMAESIIFFAGTEQIVNDHGYRFIGENPNNYVYFNCSNYASPSSSACELWRIIGVFDENTHGVSGQNLVKLIRSESLGDMDWDSGRSNNWSTADLQETLNGAYLNRTGSYSSTGITSQTRDMIETVTWKLGGLSGTNNTAASYYTAERGTTVYSGTPTQWSGKVGLMYPSDYGFATSGGSTGRNTCLGYSMYNWNRYSNCYNNDWLYTGSYQWTITPRSTSSSYAFVVYNTGLLGMYFADYSYGVHPSIYLTSEVTVSGGTGTQSDPYKLSP